MEKEVRRVCKSLLLQKLKYSNITLEKLNENTNVIWKKPYIFFVNAPKGKTDVSIDGWEIVLQKERRKKC